MAQKSLFLTKRYRGASFCPSLVQKTLRNAVSQSRFRLHAARGPKISRF